MPPLVLSRRSFLSGALGALGGMALAAEGCRPRPRTPFEGIYTDRFTYPIGDWILVHAALSTPQQVEIDLLRHDTPDVVPVGRFAASIGDVGNPEAPGATGAGFQLVTAIHTGFLVPGIYSVALPANVLREENRINAFNGYPSSNTEAYFVVSPSQPGSHSRLLWVHDSLTGVCYGSFGGQSIYGPDGVRVTTVSYARPGLDRAVANWHQLRFLRGSGYEFEYVDLEALAFAGEDFLDAFDLVLVVGQFEYVPHRVLANLSRYLERGGNLFVASHEFAIFRVRLDRGARTLTTYKWDFAAQDPLFGTGSTEVAGVGMNVPETIWEPEVSGQVLWASHYVTGGEPVDLTVHNLHEAGWILEGTGIGEGGLLPRAFSQFGTGNLIAFDDLARPFLVDRHLTRTPEDTVVWAVAPSPDGREWWNAAGREVYDWPVFAGWALATWQRRSGGAQVVTLPSPHVARNDVEFPMYPQIFLNVIGALSQRQG